jgi:uncharacterized membrane protein
MSTESTVQRLDRWALATGICGFTCLVAGVAMLSAPAALIVAGMGLMGWSYLMARAVFMANRAAEHTAS